MSINGHDRPSSTVKALFAGAMTKVKAEAAEAIAKVKAEVDEVIAKVKAEAVEKAREYTDTISRIKAEAEEKARTYTDTIAGIKAEAEEKARAYTGTAGKGRPSTTIEALFSDAVAKQKAKSEAEAVEAIAKVKAEAQEQIARVKAEAAEVITKVKAEAEEAIAKEKTRGSEAAEFTAKVGTDAEETTAKVKSETEAKEESYGEMIARIKAEAADAMAKVKAETEEAIAKVKTEAEDAIARVRAEAQEETRVYTDTTAKVKAEEKATMRNEGKEQPVSETIQRITQPPAVLPDEHARQTSALCTKDIMQKELVWGSPDDSVQQAFAKVQQHGAGYMLVGRNGVLEGIVSRSDLTGAISPYLRPIFSKWRRPMDDATLQIRIKWIMSRPVHIISPQMPLGAIMRNMCRSRVRALPVADQQGKVLGLVTETNIFKAILKLNSNPNVPASDKGYQEQSASPQAPEHTRTQPIKTNQPSLVTA